MAGRRPISKRLGAMFAAVLVAVLALGPSLDSLICKDGDGFSAAAESGIGHAVSDDADLGDHGLDMAGACVHGHCHHGAPYAPPIQNADAVVVVSQADLAVAPDDNPPSNQPNLLIRPPRG